MSVFWQDSLTFGLLQSYLGERLSTWAVPLVSAVVFWGGHALFLPDWFAPIHIVPILPGLRAMAPAADADPEERGADADEQDG